MATEVKPYRRTKAYRRRLLLSREAKWNAMTVKPTCRRCGERPCMRRPWIQGNAQCAGCYRQRPNVKKAQTHYNRRRVWLGGKDEIGVAPTIEQAHAIRAHIKRRKAEFIQQQERQSVPCA